MSPNFPHPAQTCPCGTETSFMAPRSPRAKKEIIQTLSTYPKLPQYPIDHQITPQITSTPAVAVAVISGHLRRTPRFKGITCSPINHLAYRHPTKTNADKEAPRSPQLKRRSAYYWPKTAPRPPLAPLVAGGPTPVAAAAV